MSTSSDSDISQFILILLLIFAAFGLISGLYAGLAKMGFLVSGSIISPLQHGPLMINGFLATVIGLERAAAIDKPWTYGAPVAFALGIVLLLFNYLLAANILAIAGSLFLVAIMTYLYILQATPHHFIMILGASCLLAANALLTAGYPIFNMVIWWAGFLLLTIFAERLELNRIMRPPKNVRRAFVALTLLWIAGLVITYFDRYIGWFIASAFLILQALWLIKYDVARRTIKSTQWTRFSAFSLLTGYGWLIVAGLWGIFYGLPRAGLAYDAQLHAIFVGFVFSMIFAHASVIIPSLSGRPVSYHPYFYLPLILLHGFLAVRVLGDFLMIPMMRKIGGLGNELAIILFLGGILSQQLKRYFSKKPQSV